MNDERLIPLLEQYAKSHDTALRDQLFEAYMPLCRMVAGKFTGRGAAREDLEQVAGIALLKALERYEPERGFRFVTYAVPTMTGDIRNHLRDRGSAIRLPRDARQRLYEMTQAQERFESEQLRVPSAMELAEYMHISPDSLAELMHLKFQTDMLSLDAPVGEDGDGQLDNLLGGSEAGYERVEQSEWMGWIFSKVSDQERRLLKLRFVERLGQRETAKRLDVSQMQVSRLERRVLSRLKAIIQSEQ